jgi:hypothetical protein
MGAACDEHSRSQFMLDPCGSWSISVVGMPAAAKQLARLVAMVVLPAPPFGLSTRVVFISARGSASPFSCVELGLLVDDAVRDGELQEKREQILADAARTRDADRPRSRRAAAAFEYHCSSTNQGLRSTRR